MSITFAESPSTEQDAVTRIEIAEHVEHAFDTGPVGRDELLSAAATHAARPALLRLLAGLPDRPYTELRQLWTEMPEVPIGF